MQPGEVLRPKSSIYSRFQSSILLTEQDQASRSEVAGLLRLSWVELASKLKGSLLGGPLCRAPLCRFRVSFTFCGAVAEGEPTVVIMNKGVCMSRSFLPFTPPFLPFTGFRP